jgi:hypothetical protein
MHEEEDCFEPLVGYASLALAASREHVIYIRDLLQRPLTALLQKGVMAELQKLEARLDEALKMFDAPSPATLPEEGQVKP